MILLDNNDNSSKCIVIYDKQVHQTTLNWD